MRRGQVGEVRKIDVLALFDEVARAAEAILELGVERIEVLAEPGRTRGATSVAAACLDGPRQPLDERLEVFQGELGRREPLVDDTPHERVGPPCRRLDRLLE